jgi:hypothetical protein
MHVNKFQTVLLPLTKRLEKYEFFLEQKLKMKPNQHKPPDTTITGDDIDETECLLKRRRQILSTTKAAIRNSTGTQLVTPYFCSHIQTRVGDHPFTKHALQI